MLIAACSRYQLDTAVKLVVVSSPYKSNSSSMTFLISLHCTPSTNTCQSTHFVTNYSYSHCHWRILPNLGFRFRDWWTQISGFEGFDCIIIIVIKRFC